MPARLRPLPARELTAVLDRLDASRRAADVSEQPTAAGRDDLRAAVKHFLAVLADRYPGRSVEVRVPPFAAVQCIEGARHTRGTPPAVVETDGLTWVALARGEETFAQAVARGAVRASGERSDLTDQLPLR